MANGKGKNLIFKYEQNPNYRVIYVNGAFGGITPKGEIKFDLFLEHVRAPETITHSITPDGLGPEIDRTPHNRPITRELQVGVVMSLAEATNFVNWMNQHLEESKKLKEK